MLLWESDRGRTTLQKCLHTSALKYALEWSEKRLLWNYAHTLSHSTPHPNAVHCNANRPTDQPSNRATDLQCECIRLFGRSLKACHSIVSMDKMWIAHTRSQTMVHKLHLKLLFSLLWYRCRVDGFSMSYCDWLLLLHLLLNLLGILCALCAPFVRSFFSLLSLLLLFVCLFISLLLLLIVVELLVSCVLSCCYLHYFGLVWFCCLLIY